MIVGGNQGIDTLEIPESECDKSSLTEAQIIKLVGKAILRNTFLSWFRRCSTIFSARSLDLSPKPVACCPTVRLSQGSTTSPTSRDLIQMQRRPGGCPRTATVARARLIELYFLVSLFSDSLLNMARRLPSMETSVESHSMDNASFIHLPDLCTQVQCIFPKTGESD